MVKSHDRVPNTQFRQHALVHRDINLEIKSISFLLLKMKQQKEKKAMKRICSLGLLIYWRQQLAV